MKEWFRVNVDENEIEVIHGEPPTKRCDTAHMLEDITIDSDSVKRLVEEGKARYCEHCLKEYPNLLPVR